MPMLDVFHDDAFSVVALTDAINLLHFVPGRIGEMGLFTETSVSTKTVALEEKEGILSLIGPTPRGGPGVTLDKAKRVIRNLAIPHFQIDDAIMADEIQDVRAWGSETELETLAGKITDRNQEHLVSMSATQEYSRIGAVKGVVTYADGTSLNLFTEFGVTQEAEVDFDLDNANPNSGALRKKIGTVLRLMANNLGGVPMSGAHAFCGDAFFDDLIAHPEVRETYLGFTAAQELRNGYVFGGFPFGGIMWENYRGSVGGQAFIHTDKCHIFPTGVPGFFRTVYGPPDINGFTNTPGQRLFQHQWDFDNKKGVHLETQMNALEYVTRPKALIVGKRT